ncbi:iron-siderophore ABC transporter substrate-binding protein [Thalassospira australica]|uniref:ABC transporter substrate-binding protein n=1 Tax=Thalassospira australica TaxID=1528106 RepID=UPI000519ED22|nr:iron-siderophore ABC transporter substrate-binding protein [Thalassospira australica]
MAVLRFSIACLCLICLGGVLFILPGTAAMADPIVIEHERGTVTLDQPAKRVAVTNWAFAETLIALGLDPVAIADPADYRDWVAKPELPDDFIDLGQRGSPNMEALRKAKPDLILISQELEMAYENLSTVAPVMMLSVYDDGNVAFDAATGMLRKVARAIGREDAGAAYLRKVDAQLGEYGNRVRDILGPDGALTVASFYSEANIAVFGAPSLYGSVLVRMNVPLAYQGDVSKWGFARGGLEILAPLAKSTLVYTNPIPDVIHEKAWSSPIWKIMDFVRNNRVYELPVVWAYGGVPSGLRFAKLLTESLESGPVR